MTSIDLKASRELEDRVRDTILDFALEHAPLIRRCAESLAPGMSPTTVAICLFAGNAAEQLMRLVGKDATLDVITRTLDSVEAINATVDEVAKTGVTLDPLQVFDVHRTQKTS